MSDDTKSWKTAAEDWLKTLGYPYACLQTPMDTHIEKWWRYFCKEGDFYERKEYDDKGMPVDVTVRSMTPAKMICEDMSALVFNEKAIISITEDSETGAAQDWLEDWLKETAFCDRAPYLIQRMFATGTGAWALRLFGVQSFGKSTKLKVGIQRYDARHFVPLDWDGEECTAAAFVSAAYVKGQELTQVVVHRHDDKGNYEMLVRLFDDEGKSVLPPGFVDGAIRTKQKGKTFEIITPALDNYHWEGSPFGMSLLDATQDVIETVDMAFDNIGNDIFLGKKMVMMPASMLKKDEEGNNETPQNRGKQFFVVLEGKTVYEGGAPKVVEYNPELRAEENNKMLSLALQALGKRAGFGTKYYALDESGGITTATQVASDNSEMMRTVRRHEHNISPAIERLIATAGAIYSTLGTLKMPSSLEGAVQVVMGDSIMQDEDTLRERDRADMAAGVLEKWQYMVRWQGYSEEDAKAYIESKSASGTPIEF